MSKVLEVNNISKKIAGKEILNNISLELTQGQVLGILGPNGNGKTTLLNILAGFLKADSGEIYLDGELIGISTKNKISFLQERSVLPNWMTVNDGVIFYEQFFKDFDKNKAYEMLKFMKLEGREKVKSLSKGMLEKLNLTLTLSRKARLYILDEPISGVDLVTREKIIKAIIESINDESSIIITTHYVGELEGIFDSVAFINEGKVIEVNGSEELREKYGKSIEEIYRYIFAE